MIDDETRARTDAAREKLIGMLNRHPGVLGVGYGVNDARDTMLIEVLVDETFDTRDAPPDIDGVEVRLKPSGSIRALVGL